jgi:small subunit ribosomal protein S6
MTDEEVEQQIETYSKAASELGAEIIEVDKWGKRHLAFPVNRHNEGYYTVVTLEEAAADAVNELERRFRVSDSVIRFLTVRIDQEQKRAEKFEKKRAKRQKRKAKRKAPAAAKVEADTDKE